MNEKKLNFEASRGGCKFEMSWGNAAGWYQIEMYTNSKEAHLGQFRISCEDGRVSDIKFINDAIRIEVCIYKWNNKWWFQYRVPNTNSFDSLSYLINYLDNLHVDTCLLLDLEEYVKQLTD